jgi:pimeloyl-ACP methyl ester carboxylesterase
MTPGFTPVSQARLHEHYVDLNDCRLFYTQGGANLEATPLVFLHGWGISAEPYGEVLQLLAQQQPVFAPDLPSFARSSYDQLLPDYDSYARLLLAF